MTRRTPFVITLVTLPVALGGCGLGASIAGVHDAPAEDTGGASISSQAADQVADRVITGAVDVSRALDKKGEAARADDRHAPPPAGIGAW